MQSVEAVSGVREGFNFQDESVRFGMMEQKVGQEPYFAPSFSAHFDALPRVHDFTE